MSSDVIHPAQPELIAFSAQAPSSNAQTRDFSREDYESHVQTFRGFVRGVATVCLTTLLVLAGLAYFLT